MLHAIALAHRFGRPVFLDTAPAVSVPEDIWGQVHLVRANAREASVHTGEASSEAFFCMGCPRGAIQAGSEGNVLMWQGGEIFLPVLPVKVIDKTGAGDAFIAALAVAFLEGQPWTEAGWFANAASALTTTRLSAGPGLPRRQDVVSLLHKFRV